MQRKLLGAVNSLSALRHMRRADVDWEAMHQLMREMAVDCLSKIKLDPQREAELREGFDLLDRDNSGRISLVNLEDSMTALGHLQVCMPCGHLLWVIHELMYDIVHVSRTKRRWTS